MELPPTVTQIAFASRDLDASMAHFARHLGIGPWFVLPAFRFSQTAYRGAACEAQVRVAFASRGGMEYELVEQLDETPSVWSGFLGESRERERCHHFCHRTYDFAASDRALRALGYEPEMEGATARGRFTYFAAPDTPGTYLELLESTPSRDAMYAHVLLHGSDWNGQDPVRAMPPL